MPTLDRNGNKIYSTDELIRLAQINAFGETYSQTIFQVLVYVKGLEAEHAKQQELIQYYQQKYEPQNPTIEEVETPSE